MQELIILSPADYENNKPTKILDKNLKKLKSFDSGYLFNFEIFPYENFHEAMEVIFSVDSSFLILGGLTDAGREFEESGTPGPRRKKKGEPTIEDRDGTEMVLDLDDIIIPGFNPLKPEPGIKAWLSENNINCDVTYQITSGQKLNTEEARIRLYFSASTKHSLKYRKAWSQSIGADGSVYTCSQPIYTAPPIIEGGKDPIKKRHGFIKGIRRTFSVPKMEPEKVERFSNYHRGVEYDYNDSDLPEEVLSGRVYRRYFMPLAFHYANLLKGDADAVFSIIMAKALQVKSREFNEENVKDYIFDACEKIKSEKEDEFSNVLTADDIGTEALNFPTPEFPDDLLESWPEPWPMLWENFKRIPRETVPSLLVPTILALNAYFLRCHYVTAYNRRPNMFFLNLTPSTGNKDVNSKNVIRDLARIFKKRMGTSSKSIFHGILTTESSITADTTFLQSFSEKEELFWINTEATRIFQQIKNSGGNSNVAALSDKLIELVDGHEITGKVKAAGKVQSVNNPNGQVLFYAQPETIERYIDSQMVDSGLFGRSLMSIVPELEFDIEEYNMFLDRDEELSYVDDEFFEFYKSEAVELGGISDIKTILKPDQSGLKLLNDWARSYVAPLMKEDEVMQKVLSRIGNAAEQLYCIVLGICRKYDSSIGRKERSKISVAPLIPLLEYWTDCKVYAIKNYINQDLDPMADAVLNILKKCLTGGYKMQTSTETKALKEFHMIPISTFYRMIKNNKKLIGKLESTNDKRNATARIDQILNIYVKNGVIVKKQLKLSKNMVECIGISK